MNLWIEIAGGYTIICFINDCHVSTHCLIAASLYFLMLGQVRSGNIQVIASVTKLENIKPRINLEVNKRSDSSRLLLLFLLLSLPNSATISLHNLFFPNSSLKSSACCTRFPSLQWRQLLLTSWHKSKQSRTNFFPLIITNMQLFRHISISSLEIIELTCQSPN